MIPSKKVMSRYRRKEKACCTVDRWKLASVNLAFRVSSAYKSCSSALCILSCIVDHLIVFSRHTWMHLFFHIYLYDTRNSRDLCSFVIWLFTNHVTNNTCVCKQKQTLSYYLVWYARPVKINSVLPTFDDCLFLFIPY